MATANQWRWVCGVGVDRPGVGNSPPPRRAASGEGHNPCLSRLQTPGGSGRNPDDLGSTALTANPCTSGRPDGAGVRNAAHTRTVPEGRQGRSRSILQGGGGTSSWSSLSLNGGDRCQHGPADRVVQRRPMAAVWAFRPYRRPGRPGRHRGRCGRSFPPLFGSALRPDTGCRGRIGRREACSGPAGYLPADPTSASTALRIGSDRVGHASTTRTSSGSVFVGQVHAAVHVAVSVAASACDTRVTSTDLPAVNRRVVGSNPTGGASS